MWQEDSSWPQWNSERLQPNPRVTSSLLLRPLSTAAWTRSFCDHRKSLFVPCTAGSGSLGKNDHYPLWRTVGHSLSLSLWDLAEGKQRWEFSDSTLARLLLPFAVFSFLLSLDLLTQITALSHPDFITERSQSDSETQCHCWNWLALVLTFQVSVPPGHPHGQVMSFFPSPVPLWGRILSENRVTQ